MKLKSNLLATALAVACGALALAPTAFAAQGGTPDGTITINGVVAANTCTVTVGGGSGNTITLPTVYTSSLGAPGNVTGTTPFSISVSGCDQNLTSVYTYWSGANIAGDGNLKNTTVGGTNAEVQLLNGDNSTIALNAAQGAQNSKSVTMTASGGSTSATLNYKAQYYATAAATAGKLSTTVSYTMVYQ